MYTPLSANSRALVDPLTNHKSSSTTTRKNTRFVVKKRKDICEQENHDIKNVSSYDLTLSFVRINSPFRKLCRICVPKMGIGIYTGTDRSFRTFVDDPSYHTQILIFLVFLDLIVIDDSECVVAVVTTAVTYYHRYQAITRSRYDRSFDNYFEPSFSREEPKTFVNNIMFLYFLFVTIISRCTHWHRRDGTTNDLYERRRVHAYLLTHVFFFSLILRSIERNVRYDSKRGTIVCVCVYTRNDKTLIQRKRERANGKY